MRPSQICNDIIEGRLHHKDAPLPVQSMMRLHYYLEARKVIAEDCIKKRRKMLTGHPDSYRFKVEEEVKRLWPLRHSLLK